MTKRPELSRRFVNVTAKEERPPFTEELRRRGIAEPLDLSRNTLLQPLPEALFSAIEACNQRVHEYPFDEERTLVEVLSKLNGGGSVMIWNGATDALYSIGCVGAGPNAEVVIPLDTYSYYFDLARLFRWQVRTSVPSTEADDLEPLLSAVSDETKLVFLANPANPTGHFYPRSEVLRFARALPPHVTLVLDEAYVEFSDIDLTRVYSPFWAEQPNLVVVRTFSKIYGLAGMRIGYSLNAGPFAERLAGFKTEGAASLHALVAAQTMLQIPRWLEVTRSSVCNEREKVHSALKSAGIPVLPSQGNFLCLPVQHHAKRLARELLQRGILVHVGELATSGACLRVTIGTSEHNDRFLEIFLSLWTNTTDACSSQLFQ